MWRVIGILCIVILVGIIYALFESIGTTMIGTAHMHAAAMQRHKLDNLRYQPRAERARMAVMTGPPCEVRVERAVQAQEYVLLEVRLRNPSADPLTYSWDQFQLKDRDGMACMPQQDLSGMPLPLVTEDTPNLTGRFTQTLPAHDDALWFLGYRCPRADGTSFKLKYRGSVQDVYPNEYQPGRALSAKVEKVTHAGSQVCLDAVVTNSGNDADYFREEFFGLQDSQGAACTAPGGRFRLVRRGENTRVQMCFTCPHEQGGLGKFTYVPAGVTVSLSIPEGPRYEGSWQQ